jgi:hypothetical protein
MVSLEECQGRLVVDGARCHRHLELTTAAPVRTRAGDDSLVACMSQVPAAGSEPLVGASPKHGLDGAFAGCQDDASARNDARIAEAERRLGTSDA